MKVICGDANPHGNIAMTSKGGCGKELDIRDAYRCTGCGVFFHLDCIYNHFEEEEGHDVARNALKKIKQVAEYASDYDMSRTLKVSLKKIAVEGLDRQKDNRRMKLKDGDYSATIEFWDPVKRSFVFENVIIYAKTIKEAEMLLRGNPLEREKMKIKKLEKN